jgi:hypothetical protein
LNRYQCQQFKGLFIKNFFHVPDRKTGDFSKKLKCKACEAHVKPNINNATNLKSHAMGKHKTIWEYLTAKRNGIEFLISNGR